MTSMEKILSFLEANKGKHYESLFLASLFGLIFGLIRRKSANSEIPLIPFIFAGVLIAYFFGEMIISGYLNLLGV